MKHREARIGDPLAHIQLAWQGALFELIQTDDQMSKDGVPLAVWSVRLPIGTEPAYLETADGHEQTQLTEDGQVILTLENAKLTRWQIISTGNLHVH
jgi:hypothetical protein